MKRIAEIKTPKVEFLNADSGVDFHWWQKNATPLHSHTYYEIVVIHGGPVTQICNDKKYIMEKGDIFLLKPGDVHIFLATPASSQLNFSIVKAELKKICNGIDSSLFDEINKKAPLKIKISDAEFNYLIYLSDRIKITNSEQSKKQNDITIRNMIYNLANSFQAYFEIQNLNKNNLPTWMTDYINSLSLPENIEKKISDLYKIAPYSPSMLNTYFKRYLDKTLVAYMKQLRLDYAAKLLIHSNYPISLIANKISYTPSHFIHEFSSHYGVSPAEYRNKINKNR